LSFRFVIPNPALSGEESAFRYALLNVKADPSQKWLGMTALECDFAADIALEVGFFTAHGYNTAMRP
jgi:hypothetical protein